jgi:indole-3-glycerol phosphate synthase
VSTILEKIASIRRKRLAEQMGCTSRELLESRAQDREPALDFLAALSAPGTHVIAEIKKASPSAGIIRGNIAPQEMAKAYETGGASAISVLTEQDHFCGDISDLREVRAGVSIPVLRKDFITDPYQIVEARASGADSFLLITTLLDVTSLKSLMAVGREWGMEPLVEVHTRSELDTAVDAGARIIGINNRDLRTFQVDIETSLKLSSHVPDDRVVVSESGIRANEDMVRLAAAGIKAVLVGEALVRSSDPAAKIRELINGV